MGENQCKFVKAWIGPCKAPADENGFCKDHVNKTCNGCGGVATQECAETMGLVCGCPICDTCEHELDEKGTNSFSFKHVKRGEQKYTPWYTREQK